MLLYLSMPKLSQNQLSIEMQNEITSVLFHVISKVGGGKLLHEFLNDLLTPTEKLMLSKRLMAAILLQSGYSYGAVSQTLKMSKATISLLKRELRKGGEGYHKVFHKLFKKESKSRKIFDTIGRVLDALTLPVKGSPSSMRGWKRALHRL